MREFGAVTITAKDLTMENQQQAQALKISESHAANMYRLWERDRERLARWQLACWILAGVIVTVVAGFVLRQ